MINTQSLINAGGNLWEKAGMSRVYFNDLPALYGLSASYYKTGNISSATLNGERISNTQATKLLSALSMAKLWWDAADGQFHSKGLRPETEARMIDAIKAKIQPAKKTARQVMTRAWAIAREAVARFGGQVREYFAASLKMAWAE